MNKKNILLSSDDNYAQHLAVTLVSLLENNRNSTFNIYVFDGNIKENNKNKIETLIKKYKSNIQYIQIDDSLFKDLDIGRLSIATYYRLLMTEYINVDKLLYLDVDIVVNDSIDKLYNMNIDDYYVAAVEDAWTGQEYKNNLGMSNNADYFNAGVMLVNLKKWKEENLLSIFINKIQDKTLILKAHDQDVLNSTFNGNWKKLPLKYNQYEKNQDLDQDMLLKFFTRHEIKEARTNPVIIHYIGGRKPWHYRNGHNQKKLYWKYLALTPYNNYTPSDRTLKNIISNNTPMIIGNPKRYIKLLRRKWQGNNII